MKTQHTPLHLLSLAISLAFAGTALAQTQAPAATATASTPKADPATLVPVAQRITDEAIDADYRTYEAQQGRIKALNDSGKHPVKSYPLAKAQCWLDVSFHEYTRNDRSAFPQEALVESAKITRELARDGKSPSALQTPLVNHAARLRDDLWSRLSQIKTSEGFKCVERQVACAEVELVHAGNEQNQQLGGNAWRHAKPYIQIAEDLVSEASEGSQTCGTPQPVVAQAAPPSPVPVKAAVPVEYTANVLFNFDKRTMPEARKLTVDRLDGLIDKIKSGEVNVQSIQLVGHADRTKFNGKPDYNDKLAADRSAAVRNYMIGKGIAAAMIKDSSRSDHEQVEACDKPTHSLAELHECLLPNRRVEVVVTGAKR